MKRIFEIIFGTRTRLYKYLEKEYLKKDEEKRPEDELDILTKIGMAIVYLFLLGLFFGFWYVVIKIILHVF